MPWKDNYTISDEVTLTQQPLQWPQGASCCVRIVVNLSLASGPAGVTEADLCSGDAFFALNEGLEALLQTLARHDFVATFAVPAVVAALYPQQMERILRAGHEIAAQGLLHEDVSQLPQEEERLRLIETTEVLTAVTGQRPAGWFALPRSGDPFAVGTVSAHTMDLLIDQGYAYMGNSLADDIPHFWVTQFAQRRAILAMPYYYHCDDQFFMMFPSQGSGLENPDFLYRNWLAEFTGQLQRGRAFEMTLHPKNSGWLHRRQQLERLLAHIRANATVWSATSQACASHWQATYPPETTLRLEPSIWQDHPGSLS